MLPSIAGTIALPIKPEFANVLRYCPNLDEMIFFDRKKFASLKYGIKYCTGLIKYIRKKKYDIVIDFQGLMRSALFAGLADAEIKAGFAAPREFLSAFFYFKLSGLSLFVARADQYAPSNVWKLPE